MLRAIAFPIIAFLLISSLLAPPVMVLLDRDFSMAMILSPEDEDKSNEQEAEKKLDEKNLFITDFTGPHGMFSKERKINPTEYVPSLSDYKADILVPPPRLAV
ncbi:hypothetical protein [Flagellimonas meishanensis]|uniref:hypothetical protein n=1 Tax=Flagellimonas meishanensis TaxID=2873264 RepID=UPI001CA70871|nr:hypothetical protein [[Muricauda] meishanensis]